MQWLRALLAECFIIDRAFLVRTALCSGHAPGIYASHNSHLHLQDLVNVILGVLGADPDGDGSKKRAAPKLHQLAQNLELVFKTNELGNEYAYKVHLHQQRDGRGVGRPSLGFWCFKPGLCLQRFPELGVRSIILTSGTLSPMESYAHELVRSVVHARARCCECCCVQAPSRTNPKFQLVLVRRACSSSSA